MIKGLFVFIFIVFLLINKNASGQVTLVEIPMPLSNIKGDFKLSQSHPLIQKYINYYQGRGRSIMESGLARSGQFSKMAKRIFRDEGIPENLIWIAQVSSSWKSVKGLWLFDKTVVKKYDLEITRYLDERKSYELATRITARHLKFLSKKYEGNWELAIAAYYAGEPAVDRAIGHAKTKNFQVIYPYLSLAARSFVFKVLATILIANNRKFYEFENVQIDPPLLYDLIRIPPSISLAMITGFSETNFEIIKSLNPELISTSSPPRIYIIRLPVGKARLFIEKMKIYQQKNSPQKK